MGSSYFYLEFLIAWLSLLKTSGYKSPAIFTLEYSLVPDESYPTQLHQAISAYKNLTINHHPSKIVVSGDSAGATLILSLLLHIAEQDKHVDPTKWRVKPPGMAVLISPWVTLVSPKHKNTAADYLDSDNLHIYARQYAGSKTALHDPLISPGNCKDPNWWQKASPDKGFFICYGSEEVFAPEIRDLVDLLASSDIEVKSREEKGGIHAWPVAALFLSSEFITIEAIYVLIK
jgi:acetyl esterase/lipase